MRIIIPQVRSGWDCRANERAVIRSLSKIRGSCDGVVVLPEAVFTGFGNPEIPSSLLSRRWLELLSNYARSERLYVYTGSWPEERSRGIRIQVARLLGPDGRELARVEREILSDGSTATGDDFPIVESPLGSLGLVLGPDFWLIEPVRIQCLKGAELLLVSGAITGSRRAAQVAAIWGIATINTVGIAFAGSLGCGALGGSSIAMPEGFVGRLEEEDAVVEGDWSRDTIVRVREPDLQFQQTMWFGLWSRRPSLYRTLTEVDFSGDERIGMQKCDCEVEA